MHNFAYFSVVLKNSLRYDFKLETFLITQKTFILIDVLINWLYLQNYVLSYNKTLSLHVVTCNTLTTFQSPFTVKNEIVKIGTTTVLSWNVMSETWLGLAKRNTRCHYPICILTNLHIVLLAHHYVLWFKLIRFVNIRSQCLNQIQ